jgi:hypothetical protein
MRSPRDGGSEGGAGFFSAATVDTASSTVTTRKIIRFMRGECFGAQQAARILKNCEVVHVNYSVRSATNCGRKALDWFNVAPRKDQQL